MKNTNLNACPTDCSLRFLCRCLQVSKDAIEETVSTLNLTTLKEVRQFTGAGDGCTCCHRDIQKVLDRNACRESTFGLAKVR